MRLHVNIDHVATIRNLRDTPYPDPIEAALAAEQAGADGITAHLREDRRHIRDADMRRLRASITTLLNMEMAATDEMIAVAGEIHPDVVTVVPERRQELTTEGGLDVLATRPQLAKLTRACQTHRIKVSLFVEPDLEQIRACRDLGAAQIELHTGHYALTEGTLRTEALSQLRQAAEFGHDLGMEVAAGHGLTFQNLVDVAALPRIVEMNIGHAIIADSILLGLVEAVRRFRIAAERGEAARVGS